MGLRIALTVVCTILPFLVLLRYYYTRDVFREPRAALVRTFLLGLATTIPAVAMELALGAVPLEKFGPIPAAFFTAFVVAAIPEETLKLLVIRGYCARLRDFDELMDGIVYGATAALGFAALENVLYVADGGLWVAVGRSLTSVPMHATCGAILGYHVALGRLGRRRGVVWRGIGIAVAIHGLYNFAPTANAFLVAQQPESPNQGPIFLGLLGLFLAVLIGSWIGMRRLLRRLRKGQLRDLAQASASLSGGAAVFDTAPDSAPIAAALAEPSEGDDDPAA